MTDTNAPGRRRPGGQSKPKDQKRIAVNLRMSPALHARLVGLAKSNGRSITQQSELLLEFALVWAEDTLDRLKADVTAAGATLTVITEEPIKTTRAAGAAEISARLAEARNDVAAATDSLNKLRLNIALLSREAVAEPDAGESQIEPAPPKPKNAIRGRANRRASRR